LFPVGLHFVKTKSLNVFEKALTLISHVTSKYDSYLLLVTYDVRLSIFISLELNYIHIVSDVQLSQYVYFLNTFDFKKFTNTMTKLYVTVFSFSRYDCRVSTLIVSSPTFYL